MDLQTTLICAGVFVGSALVVYLISVFGMRERTYEEAIEEQRRRNQEAIQQSKSDKSKKEKKFKKWGRRSKDKSEEEKSLTEELSDEKSHHHHHHHHEHDSDVVVPDTETKPIKTKKKGKSSHKAALLNKEGLLLQSSSDDTDEQLSPTSTFQATLPKTEVERDLTCVDGGNLIKSTEQLLPSKQNEDSDEDRELQHETEKCDDDKAIPFSSAEINAKEISSIIPPAVPGLSPVKKNRKSCKAESLDAGGVSSDITGKKILSLIKETILNEEEVLMMIDVLSSKQQAGGGGWTKKHDPLTTLKKQLQDKEQAFEAEQKLAQVANSKLKELRQEMTQEKSRSSATERSLRDKINQQQQELQTFHNRMQRSHEQHLADTSALQAKIQQLQTSIKEEHTMMVQRLQDENNQLQQALSRMETENQKRSNQEASRLQHEIDQLCSSRDQYETRQAVMQQAQDDLHLQIQQLEEHIEKLVSSHQEEEFTFKQRLNDMSNKLQQADNSRSSLVQELQNAQSVCSSLESDNKSLSQRIEEAKHQINSKEQEMQQQHTRFEECTHQQLELASCLEQLRSEMLDVTNKQKEYIEQIEDLKQQKDDLGNQLSSAMERLSTDNIDFCQQNGELNHQENADRCVPENVIELEEHERLMEEQTKLVNQLRDELNGYKAEVFLLTDEMECQKKKNNELREKNWKIMEAIDSAEKAAAKFEENAKALEKNLIESKKEVEKLREVEKKAKDEISEVEKKLHEQFSLQLLIAKEEVKKSKDEADVRLSEMQRLTELRCNNIIENYEKRLQGVQNAGNKKLTEVEQQCKKDLSLSLEAEHKREKELLQRIFPDVIVNYSQSHNNWIHELENKALKFIQDLKESSQKNNSFINEIKTVDEELMKQLSASESQNYLLESQVDHYKLALSDTEEILRNLQSNVEAQEQMWKKKLKCKDDELKQVLKEKEKLEMKTQNLTANLEQYKGLKEATSEMQDKLIELQAKLQGEENEKKLLEQKYDEANRSALDLRDQLEYKIKSMETNEKDIGCDNTRKGATSNGQSPLFFEESESAPVLNNQVNSNSATAKSQKRKKSRKRGASGKK